MPGTAQIKVDPSRVLADIDPKIYGGFVEHLGRCVYGGIVEYDNTKGLTNDKGFRVDVGEALKKLDMPVVRYPGGNFVSNYHWLDGVGPKESRPRRPELAWLTEESNQFGTDEFMEWCEYMNVEPYICINMGSGTLQEALGWLEYCNSDKDTYYANLRRKNGHEKPYNVKYWALGNEMWGDHQVGNLSAVDYAKKAAQWAKALKLLDPTIELISCGDSGFSSWDAQVAKDLIKYIDYHSIHIYTYSKDHYRNAIQPLAAEQAIQITANLLNLAKITHNVPHSTAKIAYDEWNVWDSEDCGQEVGVEQNYNLSDALAFTNYLHVFVRQAQHVGMANIAQCVNVIAPVMTSPDGIYLQTIYEPFLLFSHHMRGQSLALHVATPLFEETFGDQEKLNWITALQDKIPLLNVSAAVKDKLVTVAVTNISLDQDLETEISLQGNYKSTVKRWFLYHDDIWAKNNFRTPDAVKLVESTEKISGNNATFTFTKHSFTMLQFELE